MRVTLTRLNGTLLRRPCTPVQCMAARHVSTARRGNSTASYPSTYTSSRKFPALATNSYWSTVEPVIQFHHSSDEPVRGTTATSLRASALTMFEYNPHGRLQSRSRFEAVVLRDMCHCHRCRDPDSGQKNFGTHDIPGNLTIRSCDVVDNEMQLEWDNDVPGFSGHQTRISLKSLWKMSRTFSSSKTPSSIFNPMVAWRAKEMHDAQAKGANLASYDAFLHDEHTFQRIVHQLWSCGLVFISSVPRDEQAVVALAEKIGPLRDTFYGRTWDVKDKPKAENVAYTAKYLGLHMDLLYMKQPPGLQLLHCLDASSSGGRSIFADTWRAAAEMFANSRHLFDVLATFPVTYNYQKGGHWYRDHKPVFEIDYNREELAKVTNSAPRLRSTDADGHLCQDTPFNDASRGKMPPLANVNWSPPFQGDFAVDFGARDHGTRFRLWCQAAKAFDEILNSRRNLFSHLLAPGECVIFNNRRVVHGREAFESGAGARWLKGAYVDTDALESKMRTHVLKKYDVADSIKQPSQAVYSFASYKKSGANAEDDYWIDSMGGLVPRGTPER